MPQAVEGNLTFDFPAYWKAQKYDDWNFHITQFQNTCGGAKAVDFIALEPRRQCCWLIEVKDYRVNCTTNAADLAAVVAQKARDTLAGLAVARVRADTRSEQVHANRALKCVDVRVVLHMENPAPASALFPQAINPANMLQKLRQVIRGIDPNPLVLSIAQMGNVPWTAY